eukprot:2494657-Alexandrium_andersonii.AAC.1
MSAGEGWPPRAPVDSVWCSALQMFTCHGGRVGDIALSRGHLARYQGHLRSTQAHPTCERGALLSLRTLVEWSGRGAMSAWDVPASSLPGASAGAPT